MSTLTIEPVTAADCPKLRRFKAGEIGIHHGIPFTEYLALDLMSQSTLKQGRESMRHLKAALDGQVKIVPTDDMILGSALHTAFLEPARFGDHVVEWTGERRYGKAWDEYKTEHAGKAILTKGYYANLCGMVAALREHPEISKWLGCVEDVEVSAIGVIGSVKFKGRADALAGDVVLDLKKVSSTDDRSINNAIDDYGYHIQAAIYRRLFGRERFLFGFVEGTAPHDVRVEELSPAWLEIGEREMLDLVQRYQECTASGVWPWRSDTTGILEPPVWKLEKGTGMKIDFGGVELPEESPVAHSPIRPFAVSSQGIRGLFSRFMRRAS